MSLINKMLQDLEKTFSSRATGAYGYFTINRARKSESDTQNSPGVIGRGEW